MAATLQFDLVSPERRLSSVKATEVQIPAAEGDMTAMAGHAATITTLRPGLLRVVTSEGSEEYVVTGGFAEITPEGTSVLAEQAIVKTELTGEIVDGFIAVAQSVLDAADESDKIAAAASLADMQALRSFV